VNPNDGCPECNYKGYVMIDNRTARMCECRDRARIEKLFESSRITPAFRKKTFDNFKTEGRSKAVQLMYKSADEYCQNFESVRKQENNWLVLIGEPGAGKSHLSLAVANELLKQNKTVLYFQHIEGISELLDLIRYVGEESIKDKLSIMKRVEFLIWDDLWKPAGEGKVNPFEIKVAFEVLNYRYLNLLPTAINSERKQSELMGIDRAIGSRIIERGKGHTVSVEGIENNYRLL
jgi:DNA replication protein DnaC